MKYGEWTTDKVAFMKTCSECGESVDFAHNYNYCPNCGAKMGLDKPNRCMKDCGCMEIESSKVIQAAEIVKQYCRFRLCTDCVFLNHGDCRLKIPDTPGTWNLKFE